MADAIRTTKRGEISRSFKIDELDLKRRSIENALPAYFVEEYPDFIAFLTAYYDYLEAEEGLEKIIERLVDIRNPDIARDEYGERLVKEYGPDFPDILTLTDATALKVFETWYQSKGNQEAMEAYFRIFLNTEAEIKYPKDNMLIVSGGNWDDEENIYLDRKGHISEATMVIQDSNFYQTFSYLIRSGVSIADWGPQFRKVAHPAGWNLFGEVLLTELAKFEFESRSPTIVPGFQTKDANLLILGAALIATLGQFDASPNPLNLRAIKQFVRKYWTIVLTRFKDNLSLESANKNIMRSTYTVGGLKDYRIEQFNESVAKTVKWNQQRPARITIT